MLPLIQASLICPIPPFPINLFPVSSASGDDGQELWRLCACSNFRKKYTARDGQDCKEKGKFAFHYFGRFW